MKKFTTFLSVMVLSVVSVFAQDKPVPAFSALVEDGSTVQYLYNEDAGAFLCAGNDWGSHASYSSDGYQIKVQKNADGYYQINDNFKGNWMQMFIDWSGNPYMDNTSDADRLTWTVTSLGDNKYEITNTASAGNKLGIVPGDGTYVRMTADATAYTIWRAVSEADYATYQTEYAAWVQSQYKPGDDVTFLAGAWKSQFGNPGTYGGLATQCAEIYNSAGSWGEGDVLYQEISCKNGTYTVTLNCGASYTSGRGFVCPTGSGLSEAFAGIETQGIDVYDRGWVSEGAQDVVSITTGVTDGTLRYGIHNLAAAGNWYIASVKSIVYVSEDVPAAVLQEPEVLVDADEAIDPAELANVQIKFPVEKAYKGYDNYTVKYAGTVATSKGYTADIAGEVAANGIDILNLSALAENGETYTVTIPAGSIELYDKALGEVVGTSESDYTYTFTTATALEMTQRQYAAAVAKADALSEHARNYTGVGLLLYYPAAVAKYDHALEAIKAEAADYNIIADYAGGMQEIEDLMVGLQPQLPKLNQLYTVQQKSSNLYLAAKGDAVVLGAKATPVTFMHKTGAMDQAEYYMYNTDKRKYIGYGEDAALVSNNSHTGWRIVYDAESKTYSLIGENGYIGSATTEAGDALVGNATANTMFDIQEYVPSETSTFPTVILTDEATLANWTRTFTGTGTNGNFERNTWSTEADASGVKTPFIQSWIWGGSGAQLSAMKIQHAQVTGLANGSYDVKILVRAFNEMAGSSTPSGITLTANDKTVDLSEVGTAGSYNNMAELYGNIDIPCEVNNGTLDFSIEIQDAGLSWIAFKNFQVIYNDPNVPELVPVEGKMGAAAAAAQADAVANFEVDPTTETYNTAKAAIEAAQASKDYYAPIAKLDAAGIAAFPYAAAYNAGTLDETKNINTEIAAAEKAQTTPGSELTLSVTSVDWTGATGNYNTARERYSGSAYTAESGKVLYQHIEGLQAGTYEVQFLATANMAWIGAATGANIAQLFVNTNTYDIDVIGQVSCNIYDYPHTYTATVGADGVLEYGIQNIATGGNWYVGQAQNLKLISLGASVKVNDADATAIETVAAPATTAAPAGIYSVNGARLQSMQKGLNIVKMADGTVKKIMVK